LQHILQEDSEGEITQTAGKDAEY